MTILDKLLEKKVEQNKVQYKRYVWNRDILAVMVSAIILVSFLFYFILQALSSIIVPIVIIVLVYIIIKWRSNYNFR